MLVSDAELFRHISDEINFVLDTIKGKTKEEALNDGILFRALVRSIEIIGEASKSGKNVWNFRRGYQCIAFYKF